MRLPPPARGSVRHRCRCDKDTACPGPIPGHGDWAYSIDVGLRDKRKQIMRVGFETREAAEGAALKHWTTAQDGGPTFGCSATYRRAAADMLAEELTRFEFPRDGTGFVYYVRSPRYLKIGYSNDPENRMVFIRSTSSLVVPPDLDRKSCYLWMYHLGSRSDEERLHHLARNYWVCGEWFFAADPLLRGLEMGCQGMSLAVPA